MSAFHPLRTLAETPTIRGMHESSAQITRHQMLWPLLEALKG